MLLTSVNLPKQRHVQWRCQVFFQDGPVIGQLILLPNIVIWCGRGEWRGQVLICYLKKCSTVNSIVQVQTMFMASKKNSGRASGWTGDFHGGSWLTTPRNVSKDTLLEKQPQHSKIYKWVGGYILGIIYGYIIREINWCHWPHFLLTASRRTNILNAKW